MRATFYEKDTTMKPAIGYIRVSTTDQADEGVSLDAQRAKLHAWALLHDYELLAILEDAGISGKRADNRPGLQEALKLACEHKAPLVVYSLSRMARSTKDAIEILDHLRRCGADLVSITEQIDTTSAAGKMMYRLLAVFAEFERDLVSERTKAAMAHLKAQGKCCGQVPYGWNKQTDGTLVENAQEQRHIRFMQEWRADGWTLQTIADGLNNSMVPTKSGNGRWASKTISTILKAQPIAS